MKRVKESSLFQPVERHLENEFHVKEEVRIGSKIVDIYALSRTGSHNVAVELKVSDWKHALRQAATYQLFAEFTFVALYRSRIGAAMKHSAVFKELGVGLMSVGDDVEVTIPACRSSCVDASLVNHAREQFLNEDV